MTKLANAPWKAVYPAGLSPDTPLDVWPIHETLDRAAAKWGDRPAFVFRGRDFSYFDLKREVDDFAARLIGAGFRTGERIALLLPNTLYHPIAFFGALKAGLTVVHLSPLDGDIVLEHKLSDSGARAIVTTDMGELAAKAGMLRDKGLVSRLFVGEAAALDEGTPVWQGIDEARSVDFPRVAAADLALLQYTGGTTGLPKGAMLTHANLSAAVSSYDIWFAAHGLTRPGEDRVLLFLPLFHIYALTAVMLRAVNNGQTLVLHTRFDAETALREIEAGATSFPGVPTMWIAIAGTPGFEKRDFSSLRYCASGGAPLPVEVAHRLKKATGHTLLGGWGMTESSPAGTNIPVTRPDKVDTIGVPLPGIHLDIVALDDPARVLGVGETGELRIFGPNVTSGYWNRPEDTRAAFSDGGFLTGDIGFMDAEGFFTIVDRKKDMIICGGFNVYPQLIEQAVYVHPDIEEVLVIGVPDAYRGETPKVFAKLRDGAPELTLEKLRAFLNGKIGPHEMPGAFEIRDALPRTPVGKLSKLELKKEVAAIAARSGGFS
ncbi:AMP-binding protein [Aliihoeflea aestuarii]|uniref:AMP-binding protein n=1 Tax=Aliihoeflea aestuarii TaxID=453840 RepID=UPI002093937E|nr:AMP-binding protein [Aliihoeflea aestuarii]MCO6389662.1 AMP-binding protein [Aliihoeflea aestuarii]